MKYFNITLCNDDVIKVYYNDKLEVVGCKEDLDIDYSKIQNAFDFRCACKMEADSKLVRDLIVRAACIGIDVEMVALLMGPTEDALLNIVINYNDLLRDLEEM